MIDVEYNELQNAFINYHNPWVKSHEQKEHWRREIKRLCEKYYRGNKRGVFHS